MLRRNFWTSLTDLEPGMMKSLGGSGDGFRNWKSPILVSSSREISTKIGKQFNHLGDWGIVVDPKTLIHMGWWNLLGPSPWLRTKVLSSPMSWWRERQAWHTNDLKFKGLHQGQPCWIACESVFCVIFEGDITIFWKISLNMSAMLNAIPRFLDIYSAHWVNSSGSHDEMLRLPWLPICLKHP